MAINSYDYDGLLWSGKQLMGNVHSGFWQTTITAGATNTSNVTIPASRDMTATLERKDSPNVAWLDQRVNEMRVSL